MSQDDFKIQINTLADKANFVLHGAACGATCVGMAYYVGSPLITAFALAASFIVDPLVNTFKHRKVGNDLHDITDRLKGIEHASTVVEHYAKRLGMTSSSSVCIFIPDKDDGEAFCRDEGDTFIVGISTDLLIKYKPEEISAVLAHEVAHAAAKHGFKRRDLSLISKNLFTIF